METTSNCSFTRASSSIKIKKRKKYAAKPLYILFAVFAAFFSTAHAFSNTKEKVIAMFLEHGIKKNNQAPTLKDIQDHIYDKDSMCIVDLEHCSFIISTETKDFREQDWRDLKNVLRKIGAIRCNYICLHGSEVEGKIPFTIVKMLIERVTVITSLEIHGPIANVYLGSTRYNEDDIDFNIMDAPIKNVWNQSSVMLLRLKNCSNETFNIVMEHYSTRTFSSINFDNLDIKRLDFNDIIIDKKFSIQLKNLPELESITFPTVCNIEQGVVFLDNIPKLKDLVNIYEFVSINSTQLQLRIDAKVFKLCGKIFTEKIAESQGEILEIQLLQLINMPFTCKEMKEIFFPPWISVNIIHLHVLPRACYISDSYVKKIYPLETIPYMGIHLLDKRKYYTYTDIPSHIDIYSHKFITGISMNSLNLKIKCPIISHMPNPEKITYTVPTMYIYLERSKRIQNAIKNFQEKHSILCAHIKYSRIIIDGSHTSKNWFETLSNMFSCMGHGITANVLFFCDMNKPVVKHDQNESKDFFKIHNYRFVLKELYFQNCQVEFIQTMLIMHTYAPGTVIYIYCDKINEHDLWDLFQNIIDCKFSEVILRKASKIIESLQKHKPQCTIGDELAIDIESPQWFVENIRITKHIFSKSFTLSPTYLSILASKKQEKPSTQLLVGESVEDACTELSNCSDIIPHVTCVNIIICDSNTASFTTTEDLFTFIMAIKRIFTDIEALCIFNIELNEEEIHKLKNLNALINPKDEKNLTNVFLRSYRIINPKVSAILEKNIFTSLNYTIEGNYLNHLVKQKLVKYNVSIDQRALPFILKNKSKSNFNSDPGNWENRLLNSEMCPICYDFPETSEIYIIHRCKHWFCRQPCIAECYKRASICPYCRGIADFNKSFYVLQPKDTANENLTEEDFEFVETYRL
ncbi:hypothetical protein NEFER03_0931 [Nematocida sp. LUAm3]|nr:hypothetical protein NEFER03_0931 [Nematocida sp. LUAm3]KAI5174949.1 hypothetical protein NEFER02_1049 [Nematocida sp. LUAm2]KAI5177452.1 hypothetical protein NEFER01_0702 [Nematocida sp. LUAm1]